MYVTDSLFYLQHLIGGGNDDDDKRMFVYRYRDILNMHGNQKKQESADEIKERMISKSMTFVVGDSV